MEMQTHASSSTLPTRTTLPTLTSWSETHIRDVFESATDGQSIAAIEHTFAPHVSATINGRPVSREGIMQLVLSMRAGSRTGLSVHWEKGIEAARDPSTNRDGYFAGFYIIRGLIKQAPGDAAPAEYERHKSVNVTIESQSHNPGSDSRRIVQLAFVAVDVKVGERRPLL